MFWYMCCLVGWCFHERFWTLIRRRVLQHITIVLTYYLYFNLCHFYCTKIQKFISGEKSPFFRENFCRIVFIFVQKSKKNYFKERIIIIIIIVRPWSTQWKLQCHARAHGPPLHYRGLVAGCLCSCRWHQGRTVHALFCFEMVVSTREGWGWFNFLLYNNDRQIGLVWLS